MSTAPAPASSADLTGQRFGDWTVVERTPPPLKRRGVFWLCRCTCKTEHPVRDSALRTGRSKRCKPCAGLWRRKDMAGLTVGRWTVLRVAFVSCGGKVYWKCRCSCGAVSSVEGCALRRGKSQGCGSCHVRAQHAAEKETKEKGAE